MSKDRPSTSSQPQHRRNGDPRSAVPRAGQGRPKRRSGEQSSMLRQSDQFRDPTSDDASLRTDQHPVVPPESVEVEINYPARRGSPAASGGHHPPVPRRTDGSGSHRRPKRSSTRQSGGQPRGHHTEQASRAQSAVRRTGQMRSPLAQSGGQRSLEKPRPGSVTRQNHPPQPQELGGDPLDVEINYPNSAAADHRAPRTRTEQQQQQHTPSTQTSAVRRTNQMRNPLRRSEQNTAIRRTNQVRNPMAHEDGSPKKSGVFRTPRDKFNRRSFDEQVVPPHDEERTAEDSGDQQVLAVIKPKRVRGRTRPATESSNHGTPRVDASRLAEETRLEDADDFFPAAGSGSPQPLEEADDFFDEISSDPHNADMQSPRTPTGHVHRGGPPPAPSSSSNRAGAAIRKSRRERRSSRSQEVAQVDRSLLERLVASRVAEVEARFESRLAEMGRSLSGGKAGGAHAPAAIPPTEPTTRPNASDAEHQPLLPEDWGLRPINNTPQERKRQKRNRIDFFLALMIDRGSSDFHLHVGSSPTFRQSGDMIPMRYRPIRQRDWVRFVRPICPPGLWEKWEATGDVDFAYEIEGLARFRVNLFRQHGGGGAVFRLIPSKILSLEELGMPPQLVQLAELESGLVVITGPTGSGKSTTLAAIIDMINRRKPYHVITLEDPIEFVHKGQQCIIHQREVGTHARTFNDALMGAVREDPDLILVGEMRDRETVRLALGAAEKGVLVFGTLHTNSAASTIDRIINVFPVADQDQIRSVLADTVRSVVSQQLLRRKSGGRVAALEIMFSTSGMGNIIREGKTQQLTNVIQTGQRQGMITMDDSLMNLVTNGTITAESAMEKASDKERFKPLFEQERAS